LAIINGRRRRSGRCFAASLLSALGPALTFGGRLLLTNLRSTSPMLLAFRSLPAAYLLQAFRLLAVPLSPTSWLVDLTAPFAQTNTGAKPAITGGEIR
jgi:hypothetical protein